MRWIFQQALPETTAKIDTGYFLFLSSGSITGAYLFGTLNLYVSGVPEIGRSILGAVFGQPAWLCAMVFIYVLAFVNVHPKGAAHVRLNGATFRVSLGASNGVYFYLVLPSFPTVFFI